MMRLYSSFLQSAVLVSAVLVIAGFHIVQKAFRIRPALLSAAHRQYPERASITKMKWRIIRWRMLNPLSRTQIIRPFLKG